MNIRKPSTPLALALAAGLLASLGMAGCADDSNGVNNNGSTTSGSTTGNTTSGSTTGSTTSGSCTGPGSCSGFIGCPGGTTFHTFTNTDGYTGTQGPTGPLCLLCSVSNPNNVVDVAAVNSPAVLEANVSALLDDAVTLDVTEGTNANPTQFPAGTVVGFVISDDPAQALTASLLEDVQVSTTLTVNGTTTTQESSPAPAVLGLIPTSGAQLNLDLLELLGDNTKIGIAIETTKPFSGADLSYAGVLNVLGKIDAYAAGVCE